MIPAISDFSCEERFVTPLTANQNQDHLLPLLAEGSYGYDTVREKLAEKLALPLPKIEDFCALPLAPCKVEEFVVKMSAFSWVRVRLRLRLRVRVGEFVVKMSAFSIARACSPTCFVTAVYLESTTESGDKTFVAR